MAPVKLKAKVKRLVVAAKIKPALKAEIERRARRQGDGASTLAAKILEAYARGNVFCSVCNLEHPIFHNSEVHPCQ